MTEHKNLYVVDRLGNIFFLAKERIIKTTPKCIYFKPDSGCAGTDMIESHDRVFEDVELAKALSVVIYSKRLDELREQLELIGKEAQEQQSAETFKEVTWFNTRSFY